MSHDDPLLARLRDLPGPKLDPVVSERVLGVAGRALSGERPVAPLVRAWSLLGLPLVLLGTEALALIDFAHLLARLFG